MKESTSNNQSENLKGFSVELFKDVPLYKKTWVVLLFCLILSAGVGLTAYAAHYMPASDFRGILIIALAVLMVHLLAMLSYRAFNYLMPLKEGDLKVGSSEKFAFEIHILFFLIFFSWIIKSNLFPTPFMRYLYLALGSRLGEGTYCSGFLLDPPLISIGDNCLVGHNAVLFAHAIEKNGISISSIRIGSHVTIGTHAIIMSGVSVGDYAQVAAGAVVLKNTRIGDGEIWGGVPARLIGRVD